MRSKLPLEIATKTGVWERVNDRKGGACYVRTHRVGLNRLVLIIVKRGRSWQIDESDAGVYVPGMPGDYATPADAANAIEPRFSR